MTLIDTDQTLEEYQAKQLRELTAQVDQLRTQLDTKKSWHLDKTVPVSLIIALTINFVGGIWYLSKLDFRVNSIEARYLEQQVRDDRQDQAAAYSREQIQRQLERIDNKLDQLIGYKR